MVVLPHLLRYLQTADGRSCTHVPPIETAKLNATGADSTQTNSKMRVVFMCDVGLNSSF